tara:strand:- start:6334 stop:7314 length:981 start_codon:yes stop_codon:yes gene_type:complete
MIKLGIRVSSNNNFGLGHFYRCLSIREQLNTKVLWFLDSKNKSIENLVPSRDKIYYEKDKHNVFLTKKEAKNNTINIILIDTYSIKQKNILELSDIIPVAVFVDSKNKIKSQIVICPHPIKLIGIKTEVLLSGIKYAPILKKFNKKQKKIKNKKIKILISMGAYDSKGITLKAIKAIERLSLNIDFDVTVVIGEKSPIINKIKNLIINFKKFKLLVAVKDMNLIYNINDIAVGAPGLSQFERAYKGLPSVIISQNNMHKDILNNWIRLGCAIKANNSIRSIENAIYKLVTNKVLRNKIQTNCLNAVDGKGSDRIANELKKYVSVND